MKKLIRNIKRAITGQVNTDHKPSIGIATIRTVSNVDPVIQGAKMYKTPFK